jgi:hypothetical protein
MWSARVRRDSRFGNCFRSSAIAAVVAVGAAAPLTQAQTLWSARNANGVNTIVKFTTTIPVTPTTVGNVTLPGSGYLISGLDFTPDGRLWAIVQGSGPAQGLYQVNRTTGALTAVGTPFGFSSGYLLSDLSWDPKTHRLVAIATTGASSGVALVSFDINTGAGVTTRYYSSPYTSLFVGLAFKPDGTPLMVDIQQDWLMQPNASGILLDLGSVLGFNANFSQGLGTEYAGANIGRTWYTAYSQTDGTPLLMRVNFPAGWLTSFGALPGGATATYGDVAAEPIVDTCAADFTEDSEVADNDFVVFANQYNEFDCSAATMPGGCSADLNFDGVVNDTDFVLFATAYEALICP